MRAKQQSNDNGVMAFLLRVELPDVPGSLGMLATALGGAGADIEAIEIVEHSADGNAIDDVLLELPPTVLPDALVSACHQLDGVLVHWVSRYNAGANLRMDLEAVEAITERPGRAIERLVEVVPETFRADWALAVGSANGQPALIASTSAAPVYIEEMSKWLDLPKAARLPELDVWDSTILAAAPVRAVGAVVVFGRRGGPEVLESELARLGHLSALAGSIKTSG